jgi:hypothetical protein
MKKHKSRLYIYLALVVLANYLVAAARLKDYLARCQEKKQPIQSPGEELVSP